MMYRFFAQLLLSAVIGVGAVVGFRSDLRGKGDVNKIFPDTKVVLNEKANLSLKSIENVKTQVNTFLSLSTKVKSGISAKITANANGKLKSALNTQVSSHAQVTTQVNPGNALSGDLDPTVSLNGAVNLNTATNIGSNVQNLGEDLEDTINDALELGEGLLE